MAQIVGATNIGGYRVFRQDGTPFTQIRNFNSAYSGTSGGAGAWSYIEGRTTLIDRFLFSIDTSTITDSLSGGAIKLSLEGRPTSLNKFALVRTSQFDSNDLTVWSDHIPITVANFIEKL